MSLYYTKKTPRVSTPSLLSTPKPSLPHTTHYRRVSTPLLRLEANVLSRYRLTGPSAPLRPLFRYLSLPLVRCLFLPYPRHRPISQVPEQSARIYIRVGSDASESRFHRVCFGVNICQGQSQYAVSITTVKIAKLPFVCMPSGWVYLNSGTRETDKSSCKREIDIDSG